MRTRTRDGQGRRPEGRSLDRDRSGVLKAGWRVGASAAFLATGLGILGSCARPGRPSGGPRDFIPPMIVSTWPDTFEVIEATRDPAVFRFSERISERPSQGTMESAVTVSPETGAPKVKHTRSGLEVSVAGGFQPGLVYRIRILPVIRDLFDNPMEGPFELVFSTGGAFQKNVIAGVARDRITDRPVPDVRVVARPEGEEEPPPYVANTDTAGIFVLRYLPSGSYDVSLYDDTNRNREPDFQELQGDTVGTVGAAGEKADTAIIRQVMLLRPDTTPARLRGASAMDSVVLQLTFDDYLDATRPLDGVSVRLEQEEEPGPGVERLLWSRQLDSLRAFQDSVKAEERRAAVADSLRGVADTLETRVSMLRASGDSLAADSVQVRLDAIQALLAPPEPQEEEAPEQPAPPVEPKPILPEQSFYALLDEPLAGEVTYQLLVTGVVNVNDVEGGGGEAEVTWTPPETPVDTGAVQPDTGVVRPDTGVVPPDTGVAPDTLRVPPDTLRVPPDTSRVPPDTGVPRRTAPFAPRHSPVGPPGTQPAAPTGRELRPRAGRFRRSP